MKIKHTLLFLLLILLLAAGLRLYNLSGVPSSVDWDEAAHGYNAYSIMLTGRDEYSAPFPVVLKSFGDYKPALYTYLTMPAIAFFDLNAFSVRLPSALIGILAVFLTFLFVMELFKNEKLALLSSLFLAISPWHIQFTHVAFEASVGMAFVLAMALFFLKGLRSPILLSVSAFFAGITIYAYQSEKVFVPLLLLLLIVIYRKELFKVAKRYLLLACIVGIIVATPMAIYLFANSSSLARLQQVSAFSSSNPIRQENLEKSSKRLLVDQQNSDFVGKLVDNRRYDYLSTVVGNYFSHLSLNWLFIEGDSVLRHQPPNMGHLYLWDLPFLFIGFYILIFGKYERKTKYLLIGWLLLTPIPASITTEVPHAVRTIHFLPILQILIAIGFSYFLVIIHKTKGLHKNVPYVLLGISLFVLLFNFIYFLDQYFVQQNYYHSEDWQYGSQEAVSYVNQNSNKYKNIIVDSKVTYIFFLFYGKYSPAFYQSIPNNDNHDFSNVKFVNSLEWNGQEVKDHDLYVGLSGDVFPLNTHVIKTINYLDGSPAIYFYEPK